MAETLTWTLRVNDQVSAPTNRAANAVRGLESSFRAAASTIRGGQDRFTGATGAVNAFAGSVTGLVGAFGQLGRAATTVVGIAAAVGVTFGGIAASIGRSVAEMIRFRESAVVTLGTLMRGRGQGREVISRVGGAAFRQTQAIARLTPGNERDVIQARTQLAAAGFRGADEERVLAGSLDVGALNPNDATAQSRFVRALGQIRGRGALQAEELNQLSEVGVGRQDIFAAIARQRGLTGTEAEVTRQVQDLMRSGRITGTEGVNAALSAVQTMTGERLGGFARLQGGTLAGSMSNLEEAVFGLVTGIERLEKLPGVRAFAQTISAIGNALNGSSEAGQRLQGSIARIIDSAGQAFAGVLTPERIEGFVSGLAEFLPLAFDALRLIGGAFVQGLGRALGPVIEAMSGLSGEDGASMVAAAQMLAESLGLIVGVSLQLVGLFGALVAGVTFFGAEGLRAVQWVVNLPSLIQTTLTPAFTSVGTALVDGLASGIASGVGRVTAAVTGMAEGAVTAAREALGIASPSRVFAEIGEHTAQGFQDGVTGGTQDARDAVNAMVSPPDAAGAGGLPGGRGVFQVFIDGAGREAGAIVDEIEQRMGVGFDRLALSGGGV